jgi:hypothetical protein
MHAEGANGMMPLYCGANDIPGRRTGTKTDNCIQSAFHVCVLQVATSLPMLTLFSLIFRPLFCLTSRQD